MTDYAGETLDPLRRAVGSLLAADRRLRSRDQQRRGDTLTNSHLRALHVLTHEERATAGALAKAADLNPASVTAMVDQLEMRGLVSRHRDGHDRRQCWITLTDAGREQVEEKERYWRTRMAETFADVSRKDLRAATAIIERLALVMQGLADDTDGAEV
ncbi:MAG TPA: MarR family transcriptional regulator [Mycobacteriales bacterium]|nr:MarR family transcriptional regulator [Mycobacteriales bacterium]